jgi:hypothetical protein
MVLRFGVHLLRRHRAVEPPLVPAAPQQGLLRKITLQIRDDCALSCRQGISRNKNNGRMGFAGKNV